MTMICTCPNCGHTNEADIDQLVVRCQRCGHRWDMRDEDEQDDQDPDYGGAFDGHTVHSDADTGL